MNDGFNTRIANSEGGRKITEGTEKEKGVGIQYDLRNTTCRGAIFDTEYLIEKQVFCF